VNRFAPALWCRMELENIFLAKFADLTPDGLFTVHGGGLNRIDTERFPCTWSFLYLVARVRLTAEEAQGQHVLESDQEKRAACWLFFS